MNNNRNWKERFEKTGIAQKCPKCGNLSLQFREGKLRCSECSFEQPVGEI